MPTMGDAITAILAEIIRSTVGTALVIGKNLILMFQILSANAGSASPLALAAASLIFAIAVFALLKFFRDEAKVLLVAIIIMAAIILSVILLV